MDFTVWLPLHPPKTCVLSFQCFPVCLSPWEMISSPVHSVYSYFLTIPLIFCISAHNFLDVFAFYLLVCSCLEFIIQWSNWGEGGNKYCTKIILLHYVFVVDIIISSCYTVNICRTKIISYLSFFPLFRGKS